MNEKARFRAKVLNSNNWIYRQPFHIRGTWYMYNSLWEMVRIDHRTLGQYIGLQDKNGKEIYQGDILKHPTGIVAEIKYVPEHAAFLAHYNINGDSRYDYLEGDGSLKQCEIIGNIHQHPHLLEVLE